MVAEARPALTNLAALSGAAVGAGVGGLTGALVGMGIPELEAKQYIRDGNVLISAHTEDSKEIDRVKDILKRLNVSDVGSTGESAVPKPRASAPRPLRPSSPPMPSRRA